MMRLREATQHDVEQMLKLKSKLRLLATASDLSRGGFLLGSSPEQYLFFIQHALVLVLEDCCLNTIAGFAIGLPDETLRQTDLWQRQKNIQWQEPIEKKLAELRLGYIEQLAVLPQASYRLYAPALALAVVKRLFEQHDFLFTTVVRKPVQNLASLQLLKRIGARQMGLIEEDYPDVGRITSAVYSINQIIYKQRVETPNQHLPLANRLLRTIDSLTNRDALNSW